MDRPKEIEMIRVRIARHLKDFPTFIQSNLRTKQGITLNVITTREGDLSGSQNSDFLIWDYEVKARSKTVLEIRIITTKESESRSLAKPKLTVRGNVETYTETVETNITYLEVQGWIERWIEKELGKINEEGREVLAEIRRCIENIGNEFGIPKAKRILNLPQ